MDQRIIQLLEKILSNKDLITEVFNLEAEYYFRFKSHTLSILYAPNRGDDYGKYSLYIYPRWSGPLAQLAHQSMYGEMDEPDMITYNIADFPGEQSLILFENLYTYFRRSSSNIDKILDDLLSD